MRTQRRPAIRLRLTTSRIVLDELGDVDDDASSTTSVVIEGASFDPERLVESPRSDAPQVWAPAVFNVPGAHLLGPDDVVEVLAPAAQDAPDPVVLETWNVEGGSTVWRDRTKIPATRASQEAVSA